MEYIEYYKIMKKGMRHFDYDYVVGFNELDKPFNDNPNDRCCDGGLYFSELKHILRYVNHGEFLVKVTLPDNPNFRMVKDPRGDKFRANMIILGKPVALDCQKITELINAGADVHAGNDFALRYYSEHGNLDMVTILLSFGANVHADDEYALIHSVKNNHYSTAKYLLQEGADAMHNNSLVFRQAAQVCNIAMCELLLDYGADVDANDGFALKWSYNSGYWDMVEWLIKNGASIGVKSTEELEVCKKEFEDIRKKEKSDRLSKKERDDLIIDTWKQHKHFASEYSERSPIESTATSPITAEKCIKRDEKLWECLNSRSVKTCGRYATLGELESHRISKNATGNPGIHDMFDVTEQPSSEYSKYIEDKSLEHAKSLEDAMKDFVFDEDVSF